VYVGGNDCPVQSQQDDEIVCTLPSGSGAVVDLVVTDDAGLPSLPARLLSYSPPTITSVAGCADLPDGSTTDCPRSAGTPLTIHGENFGPQAKANVGGATCPTTDATDSSIVCTLPPGSGRSKPVLVLAANQLSPVSYAMSYAQCPPGTSLDGSACTPCPAGTFSPADDSSQCETCPAGTVSDAGSASCAGTSDFQCWATKDLRSPKFTAIDDASVSDELLPGGTADIKKPAMYCTAADLDATGLVLPGIQQCCYQIKGEKLAVAVPLETEDEIGGTIQVSVQKPRMICTSCAGSVVP
ncbi:MAG: IPT/TIG domain-containing protein, partial [Candidatus Binatia bacterium]